jgi:hypothetical protein
MPGSSTTCTATSGSGARIGMPKMPTASVQCLLALLQQALQSVGTKLLQRIYTIRQALRRARAGSSAAAPGATTPATAVRRAATGSAPVGPERLPRLPSFEDWPFTLLPLVPKLLGNREDEEQEKFQRISRWSARSLLQDGSQGPGYGLAARRAVHDGPGRQPVYDDEKPAHPVEVSAFSIGQYPLTFDEYDRFCEATGREKPDDDRLGSRSAPGHQHQLV